nr:MAG TPA: hypothetical protein [Caudoviricetes sp.]
MLGRPGILGETAPKPPETPEKRPPPSPVCVFLPCFA